MSDYEEMDRPVFDFVTEAYLANDQGDLTLVVHRGVDGEPKTAHTPMGADDIHCRICEAGARVYMAVEE